jgi:type VI secretion system protein VasD
MEKEKNMKYVFQSITVTLLLVFLTACASTSKPAQLTTTLRSVNYLNPNLDNQAAPVVVTFYQLKSPDTFKQADFFALYNKPTETLAADLLDKREVEIRPEKVQELEQNIATNATYIGIVAAYRDPDVAQWKQLIEIPANEKRIKLLINLETQRLSAQLD